MIIAGVVTAVLVFNTIYPAVVQSSEALNSRQRRMDERLHSQIEIIHAVPYGASSKVAYAWVKNIGSTRVLAIESCDVFFGPEGNFSRIPYNGPYGEAGQSRWTYQLENDDEWDPTATLKIIIDYQDNLQDGERYFLRVVLPNGISDEYYFGK